MELCVDASKAEAEAIKTHMSNVTKVEVTHK